LHHTPEHQPQIPEAIFERREMSFDAMASIYLLKGDLARFDSIRPETWSRVFDEEVTYIAEGIDRHSYTSFDLKADENGALLYFSEGKYQSYQSSLQRACRVSKEEMQADPRKTFLFDRALQDAVTGLDMQKLKVGERMAWFSPFPEAECQAYGDDFIASVGFQPDRRMGFVYVASRLENGSVRIESHSVDNSHPEAFEAVTEAINNGVDIEIENLVTVYDEALGAIWGQEFKAGRLEYQLVAENNAYEFVMSNIQLMEYYQQQLELLARSPESLHIIEQQKQELTIGIWARIKELLDERDNVHVITYGHEPIEQLQMDEQVRRAYEKAAEKGEVLVGCGGALSAGEMKKVFESIFGTQKSDKFGSLSFKCPKGHPNTRPKNKLIDKCKTCKASVKC
jgi:hypothetical protein